jgi:hypothetical protein
MREMTTFVEHAAIVGGLIYAVVLVNGRMPAK